MTDLHYGYPTRAGWKSETTSREAAEGIEGSGKAANLRRICLKYFVDGFRGTADELAHRMGHDILCVRPRVSELHKQGKISPTGERRKADGGRSSHVWAISI